jgi:pilus assembly protein CpaF
MNFRFSDLRSKRAGDRPAGAEIPTRKEPSLTETRSAAPVIPFDRGEAANHDYLDLKVRLHQRLIEEINLSVLDRVDRGDLKLEIGGAISRLLADEDKPLNTQERETIIDELVDELMGFGPLEPLLADDTIADILVNTPHSVYVERRGVLEETNVRFKDDAHLLRIIDRIVVQVGRRIDEGTPLVDARLPDGSRVNAVIPPVAIDGPLLSIRKFSRIPYDLDRLVEVGSMTQSCAEVLKGVVRCRLNLLISGGTGTGKTTLLNAVSRHIGEKERIVTIEDAAELQLQQRHVCRMETRPTNIEGKGEISQRELVKNALRMRPDRIIVGEVRGGEAFDMMQAMNTGHDGSITTVHANTPRDALSRLEQMVSMANLDIPTRAIRNQIASALDVVVQIKRFADGVRRIVSVQEITGMEGEVVTMQEIFRFKQERIDNDGRVIGHFEATGVRPHFYETFLANGLDAPELFAAGGRP